MARAHQLAPHRQARAQQRARRPRLAGAALLQWHPLTCIKTQGCAPAHYSQSSARQASTLHPCDGHDACAKSSKELTPLPKRAHASAHSSPHAILSAKRPAPPATGQVQRAGPNGPTSASAALASPAAGWAACHQRTQLACSHGCPTVQARAAATRRRRCVLLHLNNEYVKQSFS